MYCFYQKNSFKNSSNNFTIEIKDDKLIFNNKENTYILLELIKDTSSDNVDNQEIDLFFYNTDDNKVNNYLTYERQIPTKILPLYILQCQFIKFLNQKKETKESISKLYVNYFIKQLKKHREQTKKLSIEGNVLNGGSSSGSGNGKKKKNKKKLKLFMLKF